MRLPYFISLGLCLLIPLQGWADSRRVDSLRRALKNPSTSSSQQVDLAFRLSEQFRNHRELDSALAYVEIGMHLSERVGESRRIQFYDQAGQLHFMSNNFMLAIRFFHKGAMLARESGDPVKIAHLQNSLGISHAEFGAYKQAIPAFQHALTIFEQEKMEKQIVAAQKNLALLYQKINQGEVAEVLMRKAYQQAASNNYHRMACKIQLLQAKYFSHLGHGQRAEDFLSEALNLAHRHELIDELEINLYWALLHARNGRHDAAMEMLDKSWKLIRTKSNEYDLQQHYGEVQAMAGQYPQALASYEKAYSITDTAMLQERKIICERMSEVYRKMGNLPLADSLAQSAKVNGELFYEQQRKYRLEELDTSAKFDAHLQRAETRDMEASHEQRRQYLLATLFMALALITGWVYYLSRGKTAQNRGLSLRYNEVQLQNQQIEEKYAQQTKAYEQLKTYISMISHDIKAPLRTNLFYLHFLSQPHTEDERSNYHQKIKATTLRINEVVAHVMNLIQIGKEDIPKEEIELRPLMENIVRDLESSIEEAGGKVLIGDLPTLSGYPTEVRLLFQNLIANGLKFSRPGIPPIVKISATQSPTGWRILVQDNGIGLNPDHLNEALKATRRVHEDPDLYPGTGMGLTVCKTVCDRHGWELGVEAVDGGGAGFWVGTK